MRLFIAIEFNDKIKNTIKDDINQLKKKFSGIKWVKKNKLHITLKFLGEVNNKDIIIQMLDEIEYKNFDIEFENYYDGFQKRNSLKIVHLPVRENEKLMELQRMIEKSMKKIGFKPEKRDFHPHITVGRVKNSNIKYSKAKKIFKKNRCSITETINIDAFYLIKSILTHKGPIYKRVKKFDLK